MLFKRSFFFLFLISSFFLSSSFKKSFSRSLLYFHDENKVSKENDNIDIYPLKNNLYLVIFLLILFLFFVLYRYFYYQSFINNIENRRQRKIITPQDMRDLLFYLEDKIQKEENKFFVSKTGIDFLDIYDDKYIPYKNEENNYIINILSNQCSYYLNYLKIHMNFIYAAEIELGYINFGKGLQEILLFIEIFIEYYLQKNKDKEYYGLLSKKDKEKREKENKKDTKYVDKIFSIDKFYKIFLKEFFEQKVWYLPERYVRQDWMIKEKYIQKISSKTKEDKSKESFIQGLLLIMDFFAYKLQFILSRDKKIKRKNNGKMVFFSFPNDNKKKEKSVSISSWYNRKVFGDRYLPIDLTMNLKRINKNLSEIKKYILSEKKK